MSSCPRTRVVGTYCFGMGLPKVDTIVMNRRVPTDKMSLTFVLSAGGKDAMHSPTKQPTSASLPSELSRSSPSVLTCISPYLCRAHNCDPDGVHLNTTWNSCQHATLPCVLQEAVSLVLYSVRGGARDRLLHSRLAYLLSTTSILLPNEQPLRML
jgi:hypothetical protein